MALKRPADGTRARPSSADPDVGGPDPGDIDDDDLECLTAVTLGSLTVEPRRIEPFSGGATLRWSARVPTGCRVGVALNGRPVKRAGTMEVQPAITTRYALSATSGRLSRTLGSVTVTVDTAACATAEVSEDLIRQQLHVVLAEFDAETASAYDMSLRSLRVDTSGIHASMKGRINVNNFVDPDVSIDFIVRLRVTQGEIEPYYTSFAVDIDWPWWVTTLSLGVTKIIEEFKEEKAEGRLKPKILAKVADRIADFVALLGDDLRPYTAATVENAVVVTACPEGEEADLPWQVFIPTKAVLNR